MRKATLTGMRRHLAALLIAGPLLAACGDDGVTPEPPLEVGSMTAVSRTTFEGPAGEALTDHVVVQVTSTTGVPMPGQIVSFVVDGNADANPSSVHTDAAGRASTTWRLSTTAGANTLTATVPGASPVSFTATGVAGAAAEMRGVAGAETQTAVAGTAVASPPSVRVTDRHGNPVAGETVTFAVTSGGGSIVGSNAVTSNAEGIATVGGWTLGGSTGTNTLMALHPVALPILFVAQGVTGPPAAVSVVQGGDQTAPVMGAVPVPPQVMVLDAQGNPVEGATVTFAVASGGGTVVGGTQVTNALGRATVGTWLLGRTAGMNTLSVTVGDLPPVFIAATGRPGSAASMTLYDGGEQQAEIGGVAPVSPAVRVVDAWDNPVAGVPVNFVIVAGGGSVSGAQRTTDSLGIARVGSWTMGPLEGVNTLSATSPGLGFVTFNISTVNPARQRARQMLQGLRMINYFPVDAAFEDMWLHWQPGTIAADFARIRSLGFNAVRLAVTVRAFGFPGLDPALLPRLEQAIQLANAAGLLVQLTLYEGLADLQFIDFGREWANVVLAPYRNDPRIAYIDMASGIDATNMQTRAWLQALYPHVKSLVGNVPVTASFRTGFGAAAQIQAFRSAGLDLDFYDVHFYGWADMAMHHLRTAQGAAMNTPVYVSRVAWPTGLSMEGDYPLDGVAGTQAAREAIQEQYYRILYRTTRTLNMPNPAPWLFADISPEGVPETIESDMDLERSMGILREDYSLKPAAQAIQAINNGSDISTSFNSSFESADENGVPTMWRTSGPALFMRDDTIAAIGTASGRLQWAGFSDDGDIPSIYTTPIALPVPGSTVQLTVAVSGVNIVNRVNVKLEWLNAAGTVISTALNQQSPDGTFDWTQVRVEAAMPAGAASVRIRLESPQNFGGTLWFDDVRLNQP